jgi:hypothetical protein
MILSALGKVRRTQSTAAGVRPHAGDYGECRLVECEVVQAS